jgi:hypothetical protein
MARLKRHFDVQVFGTDLDANAMRALPSMFHSRVWSSTSSVTTARTGSARKSVRWRSSRSKI